MQNIRIGARRTRLLREPQVDSAGVTTAAHASDDRWARRALRSALGFRNLANYIARSLLEAGGFRPQLHPGM
jgi:hypothetical protein